MHENKTARVFAAGLLSAIAFGYSGLLVATYFQTASPSELAPSVAELDRLLFHPAKPISPLERRLVMSNTPLGTGPLIVGQPAKKIVSLSAAELAEREAERQALLDWIRAGASRTAYEQDCYTLSAAAEACSLTSELAIEPGDGTTLASNQVRIRSIIQARCLNCHDEEGDDTARLIPFDTYEAMARYLVPESNGDGGRAWLASSLALLFPLAGISGVAFSCTGYSRFARSLTITATAAMLAIVAVCLAAGSGTMPILLAAGLAAVVGSMLQILAAMIGLMGIRQDVRRFLPAARMNLTCPARSLTET